MEKDNGKHGKSSEAEEKKEEKKPPQVEPKGSTDDIPKPPKD